MRRTGSLRATILLAALAVAGCASKQPRVRNVFRGPGDPGAEVLLTVENNDFRDATIYAHWHGVRDRVGTVTGKTTETFSMRWRAEEVRLEVDFLGLGGFFTERIGVWEGDHLDFMIPVGE